jgi:hypothetical protein
MEPGEIKKLSEKAKEFGEKTIGITMAIIAVLLGFATMLGHRTHMGLLPGQEDPLPHVQCKFRNGGTHRGRRFCGDFSGRASEQSSGSRRGWLTSDYVHDHRHECNDDFAIGIVACVGRSPHCVNATSFIRHRTGISASRSFGND